MVVSQIIQLLKALSLSKDYTSTTMLNLPMSALSLRSYFLLLLEAISMLMPFYLNFVILICNHKYLMVVSMWWTNHHILDCFTYLTFFTNLTNSIHQYPPIYIYLFVYFLFFYFFLIIFALHFCLHHFIKCLFHH
jgi:hypothetical protein